MLRAFLHTNTRGLGYPQAPRLSLMLARETKGRYVIETWGGHWGRQKANPSPSKKKKNARKCMPTPTYVHSSFVFFSLFVVDFRRRHRTTPRNTGNGLRKNDISATKASCRHGLWSGPVSCALSCMKHAKTIFFFFVETTRAPRLQ